MASEETTTEQAPLQIEQIIQPKVTVGFERSVQVRPFESAKASVFIQADVPIGYTAHDLEKGLRDAFFQAKAQIFEQLGLEFEINEHGIVMEVLTKAFGPVEVGPEGNKPEPGYVPSSNGDNTAPSSNGDSLKCANNVHHKMWDNRDKKAKGEYKATAPDGKCSECDYKLWPAKV